MNLEESPPPKNLPCNENSLINKSHESTSIINVDVDYHQASPLV